MVLDGWIDDCVCCLLLLLFMDHCSLFPPLIPVGPVHAGKADDTHETVHTYIHMYVHTHFHAYVHTVRSMPLCPAQAGDVRTIIISLSWMWLLAFRYRGHH